MSMVVLNGAEGRGKALGQYFAAAVAGGLALAAWTWATYELSPEHIKPWIRALPQLVIPAAALPVIDSYSRLRVSGETMVINDDSQHIWHASFGSSVEIEYDRLLDVSVRRTNLLQRLTNTGLVTVHFVPARFDNEIEMSANYVYQPYKMKETLLDRLTFDA